MSLSFPANVKACCVFHKDETKTANVICVTHGTLFCYSCHVAKKHDEKGCDVKEIKTLPASENLKIEILLIKQEAIRKDSNLSSHVAKVKQKESELKVEINAFYNNLSKGLTQMHSDILESLETQVKVILSRLDEDTSAINPLKNDVSSLIDQLDQLGPETAKNKKEAIEFALKKISERSTVDGWFHKNVVLERGLCPARGLGEVILCEADTEYDIPDLSLKTLKTEDNYLEPISTKKQADPYKGSSEENCYKSSTPKEDPYTSSDICPDYTDSKNISGSRPTHKPLEEPTKKESDKDIKLSKPQREFKVRWPFWKTKDKEEKQPPSTSPACDRKRNLPSPNNSDSKPTLASQPVYADASFARLLIKADTTIQLHPKEVWKKAARLTKITALKNLNRFVFLDSANDEVILSDNRGKVLERNVCKSPIDLLSFDDENIAVLHGSSIQIAVYQLADKRLTKENNFHIHKTENLTPSDVTGFNKSPSLMEFVVVAKNKIFFINERGEILRKHEFDESSVSVSDYETEPVFLTSYDFSKYCLYILKVATTKKTLKCYNFKDKKFEWRVCCSDEEFQPEAVEQHEDKLLVLSKTVVTAFSKDTGESVEPLAHIKCLSADAIGFCVLYDTGKVAITGQSKDLTASLTVGFVAI